MLAGLLSAVRYFLDGGRQPRARDATAATQGHADRAEAISIIAQVAGSGTAACGAYWRSNASVEGVVTTRLISAANARNWTIARRLVAVVPQSPTDAVTTCDRPS